MRVACVACERDRVLCRLWTVNASSHWILPHPTSLAPYITASCSAVRSSSDRCTLTCVRTCPAIAPLVRRKTHAVAPASVSIINMQPSALHPQQPSAALHRVGQPVLCCFRTWLSLSSSPCPALQVKYRRSPTEPSCFPQQSSNTTPTHSPPPKWHGPRKANAPACRVDTSSRRSPRVSSCASGGGKRRGLPRAEEEAEAELEVLPLQALLCRC